MAPDDTIHFVSLGCSKNRVDSEVMLAVAQGVGYRTVRDPSAARVIVVNTCGFIDAAKQESIDTILELAVHKQNGSCRQLIVAGCLSQRYPEELASGLPEVDCFLGSSDMLRLGQVLKGSRGRIHVGDPNQWLMRALDPRALSTRTGSAYVKLAEGCNRECAFCVIPRIRGRQRSRPIGDVVEEVQKLAASGVCEVNLISQDSIAYGRDLGDGTNLAQVVRQIADVPGLSWVRIQYLYPERFTDELVALLAEHPRVVPYVDIPLQHAAGAVLARMRRGQDEQRFRRLLERLRKQIPELVVRSAFIVGHPGESRAHFDTLCAFVRWARFDHVGVFCYSDEEGTPSQALQGKVALRVAESRARRLMEIQREISRKNNDARVGSELEVLVEGPSDDSTWVMTGRHAGQAPEVDGLVYLSGEPAHPEQMLRVRVTQAADYDLVGEVLEGRDPALPQPSGSPRPGSNPKHTDENALVRRSLDQQRTFLRTL